MSFSGDANTGLYASAADEIAMATGGTQRVKVSSTAMTLAVPIAIESVTAPTLINSWVNYGGAYLTAGYWKDAFGLVHLQGSIKDGAGGTAAFQLPTGYRPAASCTFFNLSVYITVQADGYVVMSGTSALAGLDGVYFRTT
jgi:hypothetical protein